MTEQLHTPALSGRELSRARRKAMSFTGANIKLGNSNSGAVAGSAQSFSAKAPAAGLLDSSGKPLTGKALSMARRAMLSQGGKSSLTTRASAASVTAPASNVPASSAIESKPSVADVAQAEACCDACAADDNYTEPCTPCADGADAGSREVKNNEALDSLCDIIEDSPPGSVNASSSVRAYCRDRRNTLSRKGKLGLPGKAGSAARKSVVRGARGSSLTGRALAMLHREDRCSVGRGDSAACRPSGRMRPGSDTAPPKVEVGTTLSGQAVSGTQVEQTEKVTGSEAGGCRAITGTEYLGTEQFGKLCSIVPQANEPKVAMSETTHGQLMTGSNVAVTGKVTGSEAGSCKAVTGSEYLGVDHFESICSTRNVARSQGKVIAGSTSKNQLITGADEARDNAMTGSESGAMQNVTGSAYTNMKPRTMSAQAPSKVGVSHTATGMVVSGGESSRIAGITGDEQDACGVVTGSEYVSSERFQSACGTGPTLTPPAKVGVDASRGGMTITGNLVDRDEKVTGNEPGTCQHVTGSQYDSSASHGFCDQRSDKVHEMHTLVGRRLTGTEASPSPKLTGDDRGSCSGVTGSEYVSQEYFQQSCPQTPQSSTRMTGLSRTWHNQVVSGVQTGHSQKTTGDEHGLCNTVTGSSYAGREQVSEFCDATVAAQGEQRLAQHDGVPTQPVSGMTPVMDERMGGNFQRGKCQQLTGTPYQGQREQALCNSGNQHHLAQAAMGQSGSLTTTQTTTQTTTNSVAEVYKADFTVMSPARAAKQQRDNEPVHSSVYARRSSITGAVNKAEGVISGTPEFRHGREQQLVTEMATAQPEKNNPERITGEGSESGTSITGDDWSRGGAVTGTEGLFSSSRNQTQQGASIQRNNIGAHALKDRERPEAAISKVTGSSGGSCDTGLVTLSGGARA